MHYLACYSAFDMYIYYVVETAEKAIDVQGFIPCNGNLSRKKTFTNWWENGILRRKLLWIACLYRLLLTEPSNNRGENFR